MSDTITAQEIFDIVRERARDKRKAANGHACKYRAKVDGQVLACFAGVLIRDDEYHVNMEGRGVSDMPDAMLPERLLPHLDLVSRLQGIHDWRAVGEWDRSLSQLAMELELRFDP